jgi:hypothetical protein
MVLETVFYAFGYFFTDPIMEIGALCFVIVLTLIIIYYSSR